MPADLTLIKSGIPEVDDCKILTRLQAFIVPQGVVATLENVIRDSKGNPIDLSDWLIGSASESGSLSMSVSAPAGTVKLRIREWVAGGRNCEDRIWDVYGDSVDPHNGVVRATLTPKIVERAGIFELNWAILNANGRPVVVTKGIMSVEKTLFPVRFENAWDNLGPPTIQEVRMRLMDSSAAENGLLDSVEFSDEQILHAMATPIMTWNETPPPLRVQQTSQTFPYRAAWMSGTLAQLLMMAANNYRRNTFRTAAGATSDKDKEREYITEGRRLWDEYMAWLYNKKVEVNLKAFVGSNNSPYSSRSGW